MNIGIMKNQFENIRKTINEVQKVITNDGFFVEAKDFLAKSAGALENNNIAKSKDFLIMAKESANREKKIMKKLQNLLGATWREGTSFKLHGSIKRELKAGGLDAAEGLLSKLEDAIKNEMNVVSKLKDVRSLINQKLSGADPKKAERYYKESFSELKKGKFNEAKELGDNAKDAAKPSLGYLLQAARDFYKNASSNYEKKQFEESIEIWNKSIAEYERAEEIAKEKDDDEMIDKIKSNVDKIQRCIEESEIAIDNREIAKFVKMSDKKVETIEELLKNHDYDQSINVLNDAFGNAEQALNLAEKRNFEDGKDKIERRIENISKRIEYGRLEKGRYLLENAVKEIEKAPEKSEKKLYKVLQYLESLKMKSEAFNSLVESCKKSIIETKMKQVEKEMTESEELFDKERYYDAREIYIKLENYLDGVEEETVRLKVTSLIDDIRKTRTICDENRNICNDRFIELPGLSKKPLIRIDEIDDFIPRGQGHRRILPDPQKIDLLERDYDISGYLGGGGFANVYKAKYKHENKVVALKVPKVVNKFTEKMFFDEFSNWKNLNHRNIVKLLEPRLEPTPHLVIEYVDGSSLDMFLKKRDRDIKKACRICFDVASGIQYSHSRNIAHCDLKPRNILINNIGEAKITDFGIAKTVASTTGAKGLTLISSAPEQLEKKADERTDVYQVGLILYQMFTGINPFDIADDEGIIEKKIKEEIPEPPSTFNSNVEPLDEIVMKCLSKNPEDRPTIRKVREILYWFMKKYHGESLPLSKDYESYVQLAVDSAFMAAKYGDLSSCISYLKGAQKKSIRTKQRSDIGTLINQLETMLESDLKPSDKAIDQIASLLEEF